MQNILKNLSIFVSDISFFGRDPLQNILGETFKFDPYILRGHVISILDKAPPELLPSALSTHHSHLSFILKNLPRSLTNVLMISIAF